MPSRTAQAGTRACWTSFVLEKQLLQYIRTEDIDLRITWNFSSRRKDRFQAVLKNHASYRDTLNPIGREPDLTFLAEYKDSENMAIRTYESLVYGSEYDPQLRFCVRQKQDPREVIAANGIKELFDSMEGQAALEIAVGNTPGQKDGSSPPAAAGAPTGKGNSSTPSSEQLNPPIATDKACREDE